MYLPSVSRSHCAVLRTVPRMYWPVTRQSMDTFALFLTVRTTALALVAPVRTFTAPRTAEVVAALAALTSTRSVAPVAASARTGASRNLLAERSMESGLPWWRVDSTRFASGGCPARSPLGAGQLRALPVDQGRHAEQLSVLFGVSSLIDGKGDLAVVLADGEIVDGPHAAVA